jgi:hypothetical protein
MKSVPSELPKQREQFGLSQPPQVGGSAVQTFFKGRGSSMTMFAIRTVADAGVRMGTVRVER